jgi:hypothetical protein
MQKNQKILLGLVAVGGLLIAILLYFLIKPNSNPKPTTENSQVRNRISEPVNEIDINDGPYLKLIPKADGRNMTIQVVSVKKPADSMDYELEYQAGSTTQGEFKSIDLSSLPAQIDAFFGSCSAGGACTYHTDIVGGSLLARFESISNDTYVLKQDWRYFDNQEKSTKIASKDAKFQLESDDLKTQKIMVVYNTPGYPGNFDELGKLISEVYTVNSSSSLSGKGSLIMRTNETINSDQTASILGFDGSNWLTFDTTLEDKTATAQVDLLEAYVVVVK